ncbi:asparagine synthase C-terminal domain-containing protein [Brevundimonas sp.]|uniref:asparagine synthase C-terminal domain-containing protein n=1 Tax=Brevundimonas sp. TaxID=1871086 RepID=UPI001ACFAB2D|nr:asparagine synthase C-terminal domain-containing protein [Brevundimonas sp.]MBN9466271.1 asparagine synthase [Brevundimonas sp.]
MSFVAIATPDAGAGVYLAMREAATAQGWRIVDVGPTAWIATRRERVTCEAFEGGRIAVIGDLLSRGPRSRDRGATGVEVCANAVQQGWGRYILLTFGHDGCLSAVLRDPSGALDCAVRQVGAGLIAAGDVPDWLIAAVDDRPGLCWDAIGQALADPLCLSSVDLLARWRTITPGGVFQPHAPEQVLWSPAWTARSGAPAADAACLREVIDLAVTGLVGDRSRLVVEVSGGLDSAIMATSLHATRVPGPRVWMNTRGPFPESDERAYAEAVTNRMGVPLTVVERGRDEIALGLDLIHPRSLRPSLNRLDAAYDRLQAEVCRRLGAEGVLTGKGGDVAFFQTATSAILADQFRDEGIGAVAASTAPVLARRLRRSAWRLVRAGLAAAWSPRSYRPPTNSLLAPDLAVESGSHPWLSDLEGLGPGKRQQIVGFASNLGLHSPSRRTAAADLLHPALSQPVMEAVLATPTYRLTEGGHDRLLARQAFADRLPPELVRRRSKAELGGYYGRVVAANIDRLRPHLLEGRLARQGLIDRGQVEAALSVDHLIWQGGYIELMMLALMESWVAAWSD